MGDAEFSAYPYYGSVVDRETLENFSSRLDEYLKTFKANNSEGKADLFAYLQYSLSNPNILFRKRAGANNILVEKWLSSIVKLALITIGKRAPPKFNGVSKEDLINIAKLSADPNKILELPELLLQKGIVLIYSPPISSLKVDGAAFKFLDKYFVVGISFRYPRIDHFWFTLLHELSHACLHFGELDLPKTVDMENPMEDIQELAANRLAKNSFVPKHIWANCSPRYERSVPSILKFASQQNIHPAIVAGMLQREENNYTKYRELIDEINTRKLVFGDE